MGEHVNAALVRRGYEAFAKADMATLSELFADDIVWHNSGRNQLSGDHKGRDSVFAMFGRMFELTGGDMKIELHSVLADDEHAVALVSVTASRGDQRYSGNGVHVFHVRDRRVTEFWGFDDDPYSTDELFA